MHESDQTDAVVPGSERSFGWVMAAFFAIIGLFPLVRGHGPHWWLLAIALVFFVAGLLRPSLLIPLNHAWFRLGLLLHKFINPVIMAFIFFLSVVPTALIRRVFVKDPLHLRYDRSASSYWIERNPPGLRPDSMRDLF